MSEHTIRPYAQRENQMKNVIYEQVTVEVPRAIMALLRQCENQLKMTAKGYIEQSVIEMIRADLDASTVFTHIPEKLQESLVAIG